MVFVESKKTLNPGGNKSIDEISNQGRYAKTGSGIYGYFHHWISEEKQFI
jgi:hypothetical protein